MEEINGLANNIKTLKANMAILKKQLANKKECVKKNAKYNTDEAFREERKKKSLEYYYKVVKPKIEKAKIVTD
jgi:hypothetical protein